MEIKTASFVTSLAQYREEPPVTLPQLAVVGKSNVGKSSLINALCARKKLCKTSATPGKTRLINIFLINEAFHLVDLPGYGFAKVNQAEKQRWGCLLYTSRARQLVDGAQPLIDPKDMKPLKIAVEEINRGLLTYQRDPDLED